MAWQTNSSESEPLLEPATPAGQPCGRRSSRLLAPLLCICVLERCAYYQYMADVANARSSLPQEADSVEYCGVLGDNSSLMGLDESWRGQLMRSAAFLLPVVGGALADSWLGCVPVLRFASVLYTLGAGLLALSVYSPAKWHLCHLALRTVCQTALAVASAFARPCLLALAYEAGKSRLSVMVLCQLHYFCEATGQVIGCSLSYAADLVQFPLTLACLAATLLLLAMSLGASGPERRGWRPGQFQLLGWVRVKRLMVVSLPVILMSTFTVLDCFALIGWEVTWRHIGNSAPTQRDLVTNSDLLLLVYSVGLFICLPVLALLTRAAPTALGSQSHRISIGLALAAAGQISAFGLDLGLRETSFSDLWRVLLTFGSVNWVNAAAEAFTFTTMNEVALLIAPVEIRTYVIGLFTALWGTGFLFSVLVQWASFSAADYDSDRYREYTLPWVHLTLGCVMVAAVAYFVRLAPKALQFLIGVQAQDRRREEMSMMSEME